METAKGIFGIVALLFYFGVLPAVLLYAIIGDARRV